VEREDDVREIKFRAWYNNGELLPVDTIFYRDNKPFVYLKKDGKIFGQGKCDVIIEQFTGLYDKNGKEIYEGDIARILYTDWPSKSENDSRTIAQYMIDISAVGIVMYKNDEAAFMIEFGEGIYGEPEYGDFDCAPHGELEIIGNIHETSELIP